MTPPRLYRHLRQCRLSGSACRACSAPSAAYSSYSHDKSHRADSTLAQSRTSADDSSPASREVNPRKEATTRWWTAIRNVLSPQKPSTTEALHRPESPTENAETPKESMGDMTIRDHAGKELETPTVKVWQEPAATNSVQKHGQVMPTASMSDVSGVLSEEHVANASVNADADELLREQIRRLSEEVERLKAVIQTEPTVSDSAARTISDQATASRLDDRQIEVRKASSFESRTSPTDALERAWGVYRRSTTALIGASRILGRMSHLSVAPSLRANHLRLREIAHDAKSEEDWLTLARFREYRKQPKFGALETELWTPQNPISWPEYTKRDSTRRVMKQDRNEQDPQVQKTGLVLEEQTLTSAIQAQSRLMTSSAPFQIVTGTQDEDNATELGSQDRMSESSHKEPTASHEGQLSSHKDFAAPDDELNEQSLLEELFPVEPPSRSVRHSAQPPKLEVPKLGVPNPILRPESVDKPKTFKEQIVESFQNTGERTTVLQLMHCSTSLTENDFRRLVPRGRHIDTWRRDGDFYKIIPGRDPLSMQRLPFYYLFFRNTESALVYQSNASRLHKLGRLFQPSSIMSAIPIPGGLVEDGEDIRVATTTYNLIPSSQKLDLITVMEPFDSQLRSLIERGGYHPIVPETDQHGQRIWKVLMRIEGYEPLPSDLFKILRRDAFNQGTSLTIRNESAASIHRLRDLIDLRTKVKTSLSTDSPSTLDYMDPHVSALMAGSDEDISAKDLKQVIMNRLYNRWIIDFDNESAARRFALLWHRRVLPDIMTDKGAWKDGEEARICNTEVLW